MSVIKIFKKHSTSKMDACVKILHQNLLDSQVQNRWIEDYPNFFSNYCQEFCYLKIKAQRRSGHSTSIINEILRLNKNKIYKNLNDKISILFLADCYRDLNDFAENLNKISKKINNSNENIIWQTPKHCTCGKINITMEVANKINDLNGLSFNHIFLSERTGKLIPFDNLAKILKKEAVVQSILEIG